MLHKLFLQGSSKAATSARAYLSQYHDWLLTVPGARELVEQIDQGQAFPTPAFPAIVRAVVEDQVRLNPPKVKLAPAPRTAQDKPYKAYVLDAGVVEVESKDFSSGIAAQDWLDRRLTSDDYTSDNYTGKIALPKGEPLVVTRDAAHVRRFGRGRPGTGGAITKTQGKGNPGWSPKNVQTKVTFSGG
jgi:hypothetical protein